MNEQTEQNHNQAEAAAANAVEQGVDIKESVRNITLQALSKGKLDTDQIRGVVGAVVAGAGSSAEKKAGENSSAGLREALSGIDEALASSVQASRLAIEEAAGQVGKFSSNEFKRAVEDLRTLEELFLNTIKETALSSEQRAKQTLNDFVDHAKISGTAVGKAATESVSALSRHLGNLLLEAASEGADTALRVGSQISQAAAGFLEGIAGSLKSGNDNRD